MVKSGHADPAGPIVEFGFSNPDRSRLGIEVVDYARMNSRLSPQTRSTIHRTDFHQIFLITRGRALTMVDFIDHPGEAGTLLHVYPGRVLRLPRPTDPADPPTVLMVLFTPAFLPKLDAARALLAPFGPAVWHLPPDRQAQMTRGIEELAAEYAQALREPGSPIANELLRHLLAALILRIARLPRPDSADTRPHAEADDAFLRFQHELERSYTTTRTASAYAARIGYSVRTLNRLSLAATGHTAKQLIDARVALEAKRLLAHTDLPVAAIGRRLGFTDPTNFGKFFTRETATPPGAFRAQQGSIH